MVEFKNFPIVNVQKLLCSYMQEMFSRPGIVPLDWRYNNDDTKTKVNIRAGFGEDVRPESCPSIVVTRSTFKVDNLFINRQADANPNDMSSPTYRDTMSGSIDIICVSRSSNEAECMAAFLALMIACDKKQILSKINWISSIALNAIGPPTVGKQDSIVRRWSVTLRVDVMLKVAWQTTATENSTEYGVVWGAIDVYSAGKGNCYEGTLNSAAGASAISDTNADFGFLNTNKTHFVESEFGKGFYYLFIEGDDTRYIVRNVESKDSLKLTVSDGSREVPAKLKFNENVKYKIVWNDSHFVVGLRA